MFKPNPREILVWSLMKRLLEGSHEMIRGKPRNPGHVVERDRFIEAGRRIVSGLLQYEIGTIIDRIASHSDIIECPAAKEALDGKWANALSAMFESSFIQDVSRLAQTNLVARPSVELECCRHRLCSQAYTRRFVKESMNSVVLLV